MASRVIPTFSNLTEDDQKEKFTQTILKFYDDQYNNIENNLWVTSLTHPDAYKLTCQMLRSAISNIDTVDAQHMIESIFYTTKFDIETIIPEIVNIKIRDKILNCMHNVAKRLCDQAPEQKLSSYGPIYYNIHMQQTIFIFLMNENPGYLLWRPLSKVRLGRRPIISPLLSMVCPKTHSDWSIFSAITRAYTEIPSPIDKMGSKIMYALDSYFRHRQKVKHDK